MPDRTAAIVASFLAQHGIVPDVSAIEAKIREHSRRGGEPAWLRDLRERLYARVRDLACRIVPAGSSEHKAANILQRELEKARRRYSGRRRPTIVDELDAIRFAIFEIGLPVPTGITTLKKILRSSS